MPASRCECGCGAETNIYGGVPRRFVRGHQNRKSGVDYVAEDRGHETPCWVWQRATIGGHGDPYGQTWHEGRTRVAHKVLWERENGPVPDGLHLHHLCEVTLCVRPDHLMPVTPSENQLLRTGKITPADVKATLRRRCPCCDGTGWLAEGR